MLFSMSRISDSPMKNRENRKISATSPEKEDRYYTTRGSMGMMDDNGKVLMDHGGEDRGTVWPKLFISLSSKEKEEDFMAMKGCKLPQRPKKRAKLIQKTLLVSNFFPISSLNSQKEKIRENRGFEKKFQFLWCGCVLIWFLWLLCSWWVQVHGYQTCAKRGMKWGRRRLPRRCFFFFALNSPPIFLFCPHLFGWWESLRKNCWIWDFSLIGTPKTKNLLQIRLIEQLSLIIYFLSLSLSFLSLQRVDF